MNRRACLLALLSAGCDRPARRLPAEPSASTASVTKVPYAALRARIAELRAEHATRVSNAGDDAARRLALADARSELQNAIRDVLLPAWMGTRWSFHGTATEPHGAEGIACGYFVATILQHASVNLESRRRFAQATALTIARSIVPPGPAHHRVFSVPASSLEQKVRSFGEGLYLIGLNVHVGFVSVRAGAVRVIHASYLGTRAVVDEPLVACEAIERSRDAGYHVTALFADDTLTDAWLQSRTIPLHTS